MLTINFVYITARKSTKMQTLGGVALHATTWPAQMMSDASIV